MTAIQYLEQYEEALNKAKLCHEQYILESLRIDSIRSASYYDGMPHGSGKSDPTANKAGKLSEKAQRLLKAEAEALDLQQDIFDTVILVGGLESQVLIERYLHLKKWDSVCETVNYTWPTVRAAWHRGLDKVDELINTRTYK